MKSNPLSKTTKEKIKNKIKELKIDGCKIDKVERREIHYKKKNGRKYYVTIPFDTIELHVINVIATDSGDNTYEKEVTIEQTELQELTLSFGGWCRYHLKDIEEKYPFDRSFIIDMMGRNHKGLPHVEISADDMNKIFKKINELRNEDKFNIFRETFKKQNNSCSY